MVDEFLAAEDFSNAYKDWMVQRMGAHDHLILFEILHDTEFKWMPNVPMDENRESDGRRLRAIFEEYSGMSMPEAAETYPASFLEVLIALAETMEDSIMHIPGDGTDSSTWFWMMLENMGIAHCDDIWMSSRSNAVSYVKGRVDDVLLRRYDQSGNGGLFPLEMARLDQRKVQLWYQMNSYILEKGWV